MAGQGSRSTESGRMVLAIAAIAALALLAIAVPLQAAKAQSYSNSRQQQQQSTRQPGHSLMVDHSAHDCSQHAQMPSYNPNAPRYSRGVRYGRPQRIPTGRVRSSGR